jgi:hypothetical protein
VTKFPKKEILMAYVSSVFDAINTEKSQKNSKKYLKILKKFNKPRKSKRIPINSK